MFEKTNGQMTPVPDVEIDDIACGTNHTVCSIKSAGGGYSVMTMDIVYRIYSNWGTLSTRGTPPVSGRILIFSA